MAKKQQKRSARTEGQAPVEWIGAIATMRDYLVDGSEKFLPEALVLVDGLGEIVGLAIEKPGKIMAHAVETLEDALHNPRRPRRPRPDRIRVSSNELADVLQSSFRDIDIVYGPTPEIVPVLEELMASLEPDAEDYTFVSPDMDPDRVASFFDAAADLFRARPWKIITRDIDVFLVTIEALDLHDAVLSVVGQSDEPPGFLFFPTLTECTLYWADSPAIKAGRPVKVPAHLHFSFERARNYPHSLLQQIEAKSWKVASWRAYPMLMRINEQGRVARISREDFTLAESLCRVLTAVTARKKAFKAARKGGPPVHEIISVTTYEGPIDINLEWHPFLSEEQFVTDAGHIEEAGLIEALQALDGRTSSADTSRRSQLQVALFDAFSRSPERIESHRVDMVLVLVSLASDHFQRSITFLSPSELSELIYQVLPLHLDPDPSEVSGVIESLRAFYRFLNREFGLKHADACLEVLDDRAIARLEATVQDVHHGGFANQVLQAGTEAGYDMETKEGIEAWMTKMQNKPLPDWILLPGAAPRPRPPSKEERRAQRNKRKRTRKASAKKTKTKTRNG